MYDRYATATVAGWEIVNGDVFSHNGTEYRATSDAEFVRSQGENVVRVEDAHGNVSYLELTQEAYDITYVTEYAAS